MAKTRTDVRSELQRRLLTQREEMLQRISERRATFDTEIDKLNDVLLAAEIQLEALKVLKD